MEGLTERLARCLSTRPGEEEEIPVDDEPDSTVPLQGVYNLVGRVVSQKVFSGLALKMDISPLLQPVRGLMFQDLGSNRFVLKFEHHLDREHTMEGSPWLVDRCAMLLLPLEEGTDPNTVEVNLMTIVVRLHNIPLNLQFDRVLHQIGSSLGYFVERVLSKRDEFMDFVQIRVRVDATKEIRRGTFLRLGNGTRIWVAFTYERMPLYCYLCGMVGHMEKKCQKRFSQGFVDPGTDFPFGEWLKAAVHNGRGDSRLPLQPIPMPTSRVPSPNRRGVQIFGFGTHANKGPENIPPPVTRNELQLFTSTLVESSSSSAVRKRKIVTPSAGKNRKDKGIEMNREPNSRPSEKAQIGDMDEFVEVPVAAAEQRHRP